MRTGGWLYCRTAAASNLHARAHTTSLPTPSSLVNSRPNLHKRPVCAAPDSPAHAPYFVLPLYCSITEVLYNVDNAIQYGEDAEVKAREIEEGLGDDADRMLDGALGAAGLEGIDEGDEGGD